MRHRLKSRQLGRTREIRKSLLQNMATSLILHEGLVTSEGKAKELRRYVEPLITKSKVKSIPVIRQLQAELPEEGAVRKLISELGPKYKDRPGGYVRLIKIGTRPGDGARRIKVELV